MIAYLSGTVVALQENNLSVFVNGFGWSISVLENSSFVIGQTVTLYTHVQWQQDQAPSLFGFATEVEKSIFCLLIECSGIGPKMALAALSKLGVAQIVYAVQSEDARILSSVSGIGAKKAEQMLLFLKHKIEKISTIVSLDQSSIGLPLHDVTQALQALNYSKTEISYAMNKLKNESYEHVPTFDQLLRKALSHLTK